MAESWPQPPPPHLRRGVKLGLPNLLLHEHLLEGGAGEAPCPWQPPSAGSHSLVLQPLSVAGGNPWPAVGLAEQRAPKRGWPCCPRATRHAGWSLALDGGSCCTGGGGGVCSQSHRLGSMSPLCWQRGGGAPGPNHGLQGLVGAAATPGHPPGPSSERSSAHRERGTTAGPQGQEDRDDASQAGSCSGCSRAVPARGAAGRAAR